MYNNNTGGFLSTAASVVASAMLVRTVAYDLLPDDVQDYVYDRLKRLANYSSTDQTMVFEEYNRLVVNQIYQAAEVYLGSKVPPWTRSLVVHKPMKENMVVMMNEEEVIVDVFDGMLFRWCLVSKRLNDKQLIIRPAGSRSGSGGASVVKYYSLTFDVKYKEEVLKSYLPYVLEQSKLIRQEKKTLKIFTINLYGGVWGDQDIWTPIKFEHPANFETLAMDSEIKKTILEDLERFVSGRDKYRQVGKAWKRGYLLYGPPGTGKSSLIAAMANYLNFDVYDLELTELDRNSELRPILLATANRSILVVEDIDCSVQFHDRSEKQKKRKERTVTLSGMLNFIDGLWSSAGDERIIVFTTNHKDKLDPALHRPGRMDMHIHMSYCTPCGFKTLANNYLDIKDHRLFKEIEDFIVEAEVTPAEVAGELMKDEDPDIVLSDLIQFMHQKKVEHDEAKAKAAKEAEEEAKKAKEKKEKKAKDQKGPGIVFSEIMEFLQNMKIEYDKAKAKAKAPGDSEVEEEKGPEIVFSEIMEFLLNMKIEYDKAKAKASGDSEVEGEKPEERDQEEATDDDMQEKSEGDEEKNSSSDG